MPPFDPDSMDSVRGRDWRLSLLFVAMAIVLLALPAGVQEGIGAGLRSTVLRPFIAVQEAVTNTRIRARELAELQDQLDAAVALLASQRTLADENARLRGLLELRERTGPGFVSASVIRSGTRGSQSMFLLDVGSRDGVAVNDPVVAAGGLLGLVREVGAGSAVAIDWTHPDFEVSAMTVDGEAFGMVSPRAGDFREEDRLLLAGIPYYTSLDEGVEVVTSGRGSIYPRGILVGIVADLARTDAGWGRAYWLRPAVRPAEVDHVLVITGERGTPAADLLEYWIELPDTLVADTVPGADAMPGANTLPVADTVLLPDTVLADTAGGGR